MIAKAKVKAEGNFKKKETKPKYAPEMGLVLFPPKFRQPKRQFYLGTSSAYQHLVHFNTMTGRIYRVANYDALEIGLFISTLKRAAFDWYIQLPATFITSWANLE